MSFLLCKLERRLPYLHYFLSCCNSPQWAQAPSLARLRDHNETHQTRQDSSRRVISPTQRPLPDNTQHSQQTHIHASDGIRTHSLSKRAAADRSITPLGHWDQYICIIQYRNLNNTKVRGYWWHGSNNTFRDISWNKFSLKVTGKYKHEDTVPYNIHHKLWCHKV